MARVSTDERSSENDLKITFEANGEAVTIYIDPSKMDQSFRASVMSEFSCALCCIRKSGYAACLARCLVDNQCCDSGVENCTSV